MKSTSFPFSTSPRQQSNLPMQSDLSIMDLSLLVSLFLGELSIGGMLIAWYMKGDRSFSVFLSSRPGLVFLCAGIACLASGSVIINQYLANRRSPSRHFRMIVAMNLITVVLLLIGGELAVRVGSHNILETAMSTPKSWEATKVRYRQLFDRRDSYVSYLVQDELLGWTLAPSRRSANGLYWSSPEGLRAPHKNVSFSKMTQQPDIALVGDSFTFGEEVLYEETWGHHLDQKLGGRFRVWNFGVPGYGLDQMLLRYERDVRRWKPRIVILSFISHDVIRTLWVYPFLGDYRWDYPFSKPRFILQDEEITNINVPTLAPKAIFSQESIDKLPFLEYQKEYRQSDWEHRSYHFSYLVRLLVSLLPEWSATRPEVSEDTLISINAAILKKFAKTVEQDGAIPLVVYFPTEKELVGSSKSIQPLGKRVLQEAGMAYVDPTSCLLFVDPAERIRERHYTPQSNAAVANCITNAVEASLEAKASLDTD